MEWYCFVQGYSKGYTLITCGSKLTPVKWAGRTIDVVQIILISMYNYIWNTYLHTTELKMNNMLFVSHYMINLIHATTRYHLRPTLLATEVTSSLLSVKTRNLLLLSTVFYYFDSTAAVTTSFLRISIHKCG
jgi:hypothetical protein